MSSKFLDNSGNTRYLEVMKGEILDGQIPLVMDVEQRLPGCVLLQAAFGGTSSMVSRLFDPGVWLTGMTDNMKIVYGTRTQWEEFAKECNARERKANQEVSP